MRLALLALTLFTWLPGCIHACDLSARIALTLEVVDSHGAAITDATMTYTVDGEAQDDVVASDGRYLLGTELAGTYEVHIEAPGHASADRSYEIEDGECHVHAQHDTIALTAS